MVMNFCAPCIILHLPWGILSISSLRFMHHCMNARLFQRGLGDKKKKTSRVQKKQDVSHIFNEGKALILFQFMSTWHRFTTRTTNVGGDWNEYCPVSTNTPHMRFSVLDVFFFSYRFPVSNRP